MANEKVIYEVQKGDMKLKISHLSEEKKIKIETSYAHSPIGAGGYVELDEKAMAEIIKSYTPSYIDAAIDAGMSIVP